MAEGDIDWWKFIHLAKSCGTKSEIQTDGKILFIEEVEEYLYSIDRMFWNLKRSGKLG